MPPKFLEVNQHPIERVIRIALGVGLLSLFLVGPRTPWGLIGLIPLATGILGSCPIYTLIGFSSCPVKQH